MVLVKVIKNKAYFKRYQTKFRRRREGKTDYYQRVRLIKQDKDKYNTPKYRLVVRTTNTKVICQIVYATIQGDRVLAAADSTELKNYGITVGLKNFSAAYCTGLLVARRVLKKLNLDTSFVGQQKIDGEEYHIADDENNENVTVNPFRCILDVGLVRTTNGARVFSAMKGAADGGLDIPHNIKKFPGYKRSDENKKDGDFDPQILRDRIFGKHIAQYMSLMKEEDIEKYQNHFSTYIKCGLTSENIEDAYAKCHTAIRENPNYKVAKAETPKIKNIRKGNTIVTPSGKTYVRHKKLNLKQRKARVYEKIRVARAKAIEANQEDDEEEK